MRADMARNIGEPRAQFSQKNFSLPSVGDLVADAGVQFSAMLLAGGKSSRMGRDKSGLVLEGVPLWRRQLATLAATGAGELFVSGPADGPWVGVECVADEVADAGPLAGIAAGLRRCASPWLLVLAVDMPAMTAGFLRELAEQAARSQAGVVPAVRGTFEPLAAIYPRSALEIATGRLSAGRRRLEDLVTELEQRGLVARRPVPESEASLFANWNEPGDIGTGAAWRRKQP
jgi:molybdenum cofactor guanylyltransferase